MQHVRLLLLLLPLCFAYGDGARENARPGLPWFDPNLSTHARASALVAQMSVDEKIAQMVVDAPSIKRLSLPAYHWRNNILHGLVDNGVSTQFVQATGLAATFDLAAIRQAGNVMANEQRAKNNENMATFADNASSVMNYGLDLWGPNINILRDSRWGRAQETYGEDPFLTGQMAVALVSALGERSLPNPSAKPGTAASSGFGKTLATCKHFSAYGVDEQPPRLSFDPNITDADLRQTFFPAFEACVKEGKVGSIMCAYSGINGHPMCISPLLTSVLRDEWGFDGFLVTDSGALDFLMTKYHLFNDSRPDLAAAAALNAGIDLNSGDVFLHLDRALADGAVVESQLDTALHRLISARIGLGQFDPMQDVPWRGGDYSPASIMSRKSVLLARQVARKSLVLLRNQGDLLPLDVSGKHRKVAVIGPGANDTYRMLGNYYGCSFGTWGPPLSNCSIVTPLDGMASLFSSMGGEVRFEEGCAQENNDTSGFAAAEALASDWADVVVVVMGLRNCEGGQGKGGSRCESEGKDRETLDLPPTQQLLLERLASSGKPVVLVLMNGGPVSIPWAAQHVPAIVESWYGGSEGGNALAEALSGAGEGGCWGRLPFTVPTSVAQLPNKLIMDMDHPPGRTYRYLTQVPLFAFGFGLSFGRFTYSEASVLPSALPASSAAHVIVCANVVNSEHALAADDVAQVYARVAVCPNNVRLQSAPLSQLVAFNRTTVMKPGEQQQVCLTVTLEPFRLMDTHGNYAVQPCTYELSIGSISPGAQGVFVVPEPLSHCKVNITLT